MLLIIGFGWAKPVPVNLENIPIDKRRKGIILVSAAGITANIICAFIALLLLQLLAPGPEDIMYKILHLLAFINILLAAFNLIPIPPLDGSKIIMGFAPESVNRVLYQIEPFGIIIVIGLLYLGALNPVIELLQYIIVNFISLILHAIGVG
jgi:Zn-dependent protease